jgi:ATP-binding cassette subfamily F protein 2
MPPKGRGRGGRGGRGSARGSGRGSPEPEDASAIAAQAIADSKRAPPSGAMVSHSALRPMQHQLRDVQIEKLDVSYPGCPILENAQIQLFFGHRYGLIGANGSGKTTLMNAFAAGEIELPKCVDFFHLREEVEASDTMSALTAVLISDTEKKLLDEELEILTNDDDAGDDTMKRLEEIYARLDELDADTAEVRAARILDGLGFDKAMQARPTGSFSGGWRMRISLAAALFQNPTLLLLDEPTNHLDIEAVVWLENYLKNFKKILFMVSHSQDFMNGVCTNIAHLQGKKLEYFSGDYDTFVMEKERLDENQAKRHEKEQKEIAHMKDYIARFGHGNAKLARQAQSKEKTLAKMERAGLTEAVAGERVISWYFPCAGELAPPMIQFNDVAFHYPNCPNIFNKLNMGINMDSRICLVGPNGAGKTTLTKMMCRELEATEGFVAKNAHCIIARFHQHFADLLLDDESPLAFLRKEYPNVENVDPFRNVLGRFGVSGSLQSGDMGTMSDGQKSRVVFAWMAFKQPHFMILDEPTNHLDIESIDALAASINCFDGAVCVVSHDLRLIAQIADEIWICDKGKVDRFNGDITDYKKSIQKHIAEMEKKHGK